MNQEYKSDAEMVVDILNEAARARTLFPKSDHLVLAMAEEAGEAVKAALDFRNGKKSASLAAIRKELVQTAAMCLRLAAEGDPTIGLPPLPKPPT